MLLLAGEQSLAGPRQNFELDLNPSFDNDYPIQNQWP